MEENGDLRALCLGLTPSGGTSRPVACEPRSFQAPEQAINRPFYSDWMLLLIFITQPAYCDEEC